MPVYLRTRQGKKRTRYYLDIYHNGKRYYEFLDLYKISSRNPFDTETNRQHKELAEKIRAKKALELESGNHYIEPKHKQDVFLLEYLEKWVNRYPNKDKRLTIACLRYFKAFLNDAGISANITTKEVNKD
ncbi:MAG: hypothetical protein IH594_19650, partial [Bacteroidales bacterium]|nr:hypothetical protein [Bacteroidales bacterium]